MTLAPVGFTDPKGNIVPVPIMRSYADGLDAAQYWATLPSARKGVADRAVSTQDTGAFAKELVNTTIGLRINGADCGTNQGITLAADHPDIVGRYLAGPKPVLITQQLAQKLRESGKPVRVRSPMTCQLQDGICQHCMGLDVAGKHYKNGYHIGALAGTTISEPITQMVMRNFHTGGALGSQEVGFKRIRQIFSMPENIKGKATLAEHAGDVQQIKETGRGGWDVYVDGLRHFVPKETGLGVEVGDVVKSGDLLSKGGALKIQEVAEFRGHEAARDQILHDLDAEMSAAGQNINRRIYEVAVKPMVDKVRVVDPGDAHDHLVEGDVVNVNYINQMNQRLKSPVEYEPVVLSVKEVPFSGEEFLSPLMYQRLTRTLSQAPALGFTSILTGPGSHPVIEHAYGGAK
jgi:DNA-directed RNA polymerase subunit beta'